MPENCLPTPEERTDWSTERPRLKQSGKTACVQCWIYLTFLRLREAKHDITLCYSIPHEGIVVALTGNLMPGYRAPKGVYLIGVVADGSPHPACHFHILQNAAHASRLPRSAYIPLWPQPGLIPRNTERGDRFENICFFGDPANLAPELRTPSFSDSLRERLGLNLVIAGSERWHDYSEADCVIAIREFGSRRFLEKPATKLYNAWMAGVPFIGGNDSAFEADGRQGIDYLRCSTPESVIIALEQLKGDCEFRRRLVLEGKRVARRFTPDAITSEWRNLLHSLATQSATSQLAKPKVMQELIRWIQDLSVRFDNLRKR
jgi:hypothetical protein